MPLIGNLLKPLVKIPLVLMPLGLTAAASATDPALYKKAFGSGKPHLDLAKQTALIISNEEMKNLMKIVKSLEQYGLLIKGVRETIKNEAKEWKGNFFSVLLGILGAGLSGNLSTSKSTIGIGEVTLRGDQSFWCSLIL